MPTYNNRSLFSDYYLKERVYEDAHWRALKNKAWELRQRIANIVEKALPGIDHDTPEAEVEHRFIRPILDVLGHVYFVQPSVPSPEGMRRPDYAFFPSPEARQDAEAHKGQLDFFMDALAVGDAKAWERSLDKRVKGPGDPFTNHNPSYQIDFYLRATDRKWGLLTNGRHWRLYQRDLSYRLDVYYEIDLLELLKLDEDAFLYFLAFFHKTAFEPGATGVCFLDRAYKESIEYATKVSEELKDNVYEALRLLAEGLLSFPDNNLQPQDLDLIRENAFIVIYRLLFIFYAEAREFLPVANPTYLDTYSLRALTHEIATKEPFESNLSPVTTGYWSRLTDLFSLINAGYDFLHIPPYNGRLFDDQKEHQSLAAWKIGDSYLAAAIDQLARATAAGRKGKGFVSYRDLSIRELGSIYEGLLEHRPRYATQDVAVIKDNKREKFVPLAELGNRKPLKTYAAGAVYLETDKGERKATGSYYTPDYIVKYIVNNTLGPLLEDARLSDGNLIDSILSMKVLDPAMGSGHFLVEVTDYLAWALVEALGGDPRELEEDEIRWARREVVERCIYGVDVNPLAVDLAKLSLWLSTVSLDKPLNFLDHHLRCGNSLVGANMDDLGMLPILGKKGKPTAITTLAGHQFMNAIASAVSTFQKIADAPSDSVEDIHRKESAYETARYALSQIAHIADVWISVYFGNQVKDKDAYERLLSIVQQDSSAWPKPRQLSWLDEATAMSKTRRFFHWELEFPEVFFDRNGQRLPNPGFGAVVGNPPYVDSENMVKNSPEEREFIASRFQTASGNWDLYIPFWELAVALLASRGNASLITPNKWVSIGYGKALREFAWTRLYKIGDFSKIRVFKDSGIFPVVTFMNKSENQSIDVEVFGDDYRVGLAQNISPETLQDAQKWGVVFSKHLALIQKIWRISQKLSDVCSAEEAFTVSEAYDLSALVHELKPGDAEYFRFVVTGTIDRYTPLWGLEITKYLKSVYLNPVVNMSELLTGFVRRYEQATASKIVISGIRHFESFFDHDARFLAGKSTVILRDFHANYEAESLLALLNSKLMKFYIKELYASLSMDEGINFTAPLVSDLPIPRIAYATPHEQWTWLIEDGKRLYEGYLQTKDWHNVLTFVVERLHKKPDGSPDAGREQSDVVHDLLSFLADEMTRLYKEKQVETKGFLTWLEGYLGVSIEDMKNKTKVKEYWKTEVGWEGFLGALEQNNKVIASAKGINVSRREAQETIRTEFDSSVAKLRPILERIELTDKLIDQIVYKLYGLIDDEIAIVEGNIRT